MISSQARKLPSLKRRAMPGRSVASLFLISLFSSLSLIPGADAAPYATTGGPLLAARQMAPEGGDPSNPFSYPILKDIAKSLARNGFPASFFLSLDSKAGPGIDLRTILLYEAGVLKSPVKLFMPSRHKKSDTPTLSVTTFPESSGQMPSDAPKVAPTTALRALSAAGAERDQDQEASGTTKKGKKHKSSSLRISEDLNDSLAKNEVTAVSNSDISTLAMIQPLSQQAPSSTVIEESAFRFWTVPQVTKLLQKGDSGRKSPYTGSFVMMSPGGLKSVEGRVFILRSGHILVSNNGAPIVVDTPLAKVSIASGATVFVEISKDGNSEVKVLETKPDASEITVKYDVDGKSSEIKLSASDDFLVSEHKLTDKPQGDTTSSGDYWRKSKFAVKSFIDGDSFFSTDNPEQNPEQKASMVLLRSRLK